MSFNFVKGKLSFPVDAQPILSGTFVGDIDGDGTDLTNVSHIAQTNAEEYRIVFLIQLLDCLVMKETFEDMVIFCLIRAPMFLPLIAAWSTAGLLFHHTIWSKGVIIILAVIIQHLLQ